MENTNPTITLNDVASMINIIEVASTRGAIKATEMTAVGDLYTRLKSFLDFANQQLAQSQEQTESQGQQSQGEANA